MRRGWRWPTVSLPGSIALGLIMAHAVLVTRVQWDIHRGLGTSSFDIGLYDQGIWLLSRFEAPFVTLMGRNLLGDHSSLILFFLVPLYWILPGSETLLAVQAMVIAAGAIPIYLFTKKRLESDWLGLLMVVVWLVNPALNGGGAENFHPDSFLALLFPAALVAALSGRWHLYWVAFVLCLLVKEDVVLVMVPLAGLLALTGERRRALITAVASTAASLLAMFVLMRSLIGVPTRNMWRIPFGGPTGLLKETFANPTNVIDYLRSEERPLYWWKMLAPLAFTSLLAPEIAVVGMLVMATNTISTFWYQFHIEYHYSVVAVPALVIATVVGVARLPRRFWHVAVAVVAATSVFCSRHWSHFPLRASEIPHWSSDYPVAVQAREIMEFIPESAAISVFHSLAPHVAHRKLVFQFPNPFRVVLYGTDLSLEGSRNPLADEIEYVILPRNRDAEMTADWAKIEGAFREYRNNESWQVFIRRDVNAPSG